MFVVCFNAAGVLFGVVVEFLRPKKPILSFPKGRDTEKIKAEIDLDNYAFSLEVGIIKNKTQVKLKNDLLLKSDCFSFYQKIKTTNDRCQ